jgi:membrane protein YqaA with SNARE-associated domain
MLRSLYDRTVQLANHPSALWVLAIVAFTESSFFPIPPDVMLIPMVLANPRKAWLFAGVCTVASVAGGFFGYAIGYFFFETAGKWVIDAYGLQAAFENFKELFNEWGLWATVIGGLTPVPYKLVTIASGAAHFDLLTFGLASLATRGGRFFVVAALLYFIGDPIRLFVEKHLTLVTTAFVAILLAGFVAFAYI